VIVRRLGPDEADLARTLVAAIDRTPGDIAAWLADDRNVMVAALVDGAPAGMAYGYQLPRVDDRPVALLLYSIDTLPAFRRRGVATALVAEMRRQSPGGMWLVTNESTPGTMGLYGNAGGQRLFPDDVLFSFDPLPSD